MNHLTNAEMADMHFVYGAAGGNARRAAKMYEERFPNRQVPVHQLFTAVHQTLCENGSFSANEVNAGHPRQLDLDHEEEMARGHQKAQSQARNQEKQKAMKSKQGHSATEQKKAAAKALTFQCPVCRGMMPDPKTFKQHFENKHPSAPMPEELKDA